MPTPRLHCHFPCHVYIQTSITIDSSLLTLFLSLSNSNPRYEPNPKYLCLPIPLADLTTYTTNQLTMIPSLLLPSIYNLLSRRLFISHLGIDTYLHLFPALLFQNRLFYTIVFNASFLFYLVPTLCLWWVDGRLIFWDVVCVLFLRILR